MKEKVVCSNLPQLAESVRLATPLARFGKVDRTASKRSGAVPLGSKTRFQLFFNSMPPFVVATFNSLPPPPTVPESVFGPNVP
jgi:hypothetical protein